MDPRSKSWKCWSPDLEDKFYNIVKEKGLQDVIITNESIQFRDTDGNCTMWWNGFV